LMFANNLAQAPAHAVPRNRGPERAGGDKASAKTSGAICSKDTKQDRSAAVDAAVLFYLREFRGLSQAATLRKREAFCRHTGSGTAKVFRPAGAGRKTPQIIRYRRSMEKETF